MYKGNIIIFLKMYQGN